MPFYQDSTSKALLFFPDEPDLPGNWTRLFEPDGYHEKAWRSIDALWRRQLAEDAKNTPEAQRVMLAGLVTHLKHRFVAAEEPFDTLIATLTKEDQDQCPE